MPEDMMVPAGPYKLQKQFRREQMRRHKKDLPWSKRVLDLDEKRLFGRTAWGWTRISLFYLVLYILISLIVLFWYAIFKYAIIPSDRPLSLKKAPGVSLVPYNDTALELTPNEHTTLYPIADTIDEFLIGLNDNAMDFFSDFNADELWGYRTGKPCIFLRLNKVYGFKPDTYDTPEELPKDAPYELKDVIRKHGGSPRIWVSTKVKGGKHSPTILYYPGPFFDTSEKMTGVQRVVAVQLNNMPVNVKVVIDVFIWARNIPIEEKYNGIGHAKMIVRINSQLVLKPAEGRRGMTHTAARVSGKKLAPKQLLDANRRSHGSVRAKPVTMLPKEPSS